MITAEGVAPFIPESDVRTTQESTILAELYRFMVSVWQDGDYDAIQTMIFDNSTVVSNVGVFRGPAEYRQYVERFRAGLSDIRLSVEHSVTQGQTISLVWHLMGEHSGELFGSSATNSPVSITCHSFFTIYDNQILQENDNWDIFGFATQLGGMPKELQEKIDGDEVVGKRVPGSTDADHTTEVLTADTSAEADSSDNADA